MTISDIRSIMIDSGSHWFDRSTMRFFGTRLCRRVYEGPGGTYFVTTEQPPHGPRRASVRRFIPGAQCGDAYRRPGIDTVNKFATMSRRQAHALAAEMASCKVIAAERLAAFAN